LLSSHSLACFSFSLAAEHLDSPRDQLLHVPTIHLDPQDASDEQTTIYLCSWYPFLLALHPSHPLRLLPCSYPSRSLVLLLFCSHLLSPAVFSLCFLSGSASPRSFFTSFNLALTLLQSFPDLYSRAVEAYRMLYQQYDARMRKRERRRDETTTKQVAMMIEKKKQKQSDEEKAKKEKKKEKQSEMSSWFSNLLASGKKDGKKKDAPATASNQKTEEEQQKKTQKQQEDELEEKEEKEENQREPYHGYAYPAPSISIDSFLTVMVGLPSSRSNASPSYASSPRARPSSSSSSSFSSTLSPLHYHYSTLFLWLTHSFFLRSHYLFDILVFYLNTRNYDNELELRRKEKGNAGFTGHCALDPEFKTRRFNPQMKTKVTKKNILDFYPALFSYVFGNAETKKHSPSAPSSSSSSSSATASTSSSSASSSSSSPSPSSSSSSSPLVIPPTPLSPSALSHLSSDQTNLIFDFSYHHDLFFLLSSYFNSSYSLTRANILSILTYGIQSFYNAIAVNAANASGLSSSSSSSSSSASIPSFSSGGVPTAAFGNISKTQYHKIQRFASSYGFCALFHYLQATPRRLKRYEKKEINETVAEIEAAEAKEAAAAREEQGDETDKKEEVSTEVVDTEEDAEEEKKKQAILSDDDLNDDEWNSKDLQKTFPFYFHGQIGCLQELMNQALQNSHDPRTARGDGQPASVDDIEDEEELERLKSEAMITTERDNSER